ncbi:MAG: NTP transferase domain-containing protein [Candidatus Korobacteraceae bacterium]
MLSPSFCAVILAAGESSRMGSDKALLPWQGSTFLGSAIQALGPFSDYVIVVAGKNAAQLEPVVDSLGAFMVVNPEPEKGQFSSLRVGLSEVLNRGRDTAIITLVDRPAPRAETLRRMCDAYFPAAARGKWILIPQYGEQHGHPIFVGPGLLTKLIGAPETATAREVIHQYEDAIEYFPVDDPLVVANINTPEQYATLNPRQ